MLLGDTFEIGAVAHHAGVPHAVAFAALTHTGWRVDRIRGEVLALATGGHQPDRLCRSLTLTPLQPSGVGGYLLVVGEAAGAHGYQRIVEFLSNTPEQTAPDTVFPCAFFAVNDVL